MLARIFRRHRFLVVACLLLGVGGGLALHWSEQPRYLGQARVLVTTADPSSSAQASGIADSVRALATGTDLVRNAISTVGVTRDPAGVAKSVDVHSLGTSGVVQLQVSDREPAVALALTRAIADLVVKQRTDTEGAALRASIGDLDSQIQSVRSQMKTVDAGLAAATAQSASVDPAVLDRASAERARLIAQRTGLSDELTVLSSHRADLAAQLAEQPRASIVDYPSGPAAKAGSQRLPDAALGGLLGLVVGIACAALLETLRPSVMGRAAIARSLRAPVLAEINRSGRTWDAPDVLEAAMHTQLAAAGANVSRVELLATSPRIDVAGLAAALAPELGSTAVGVVNVDSTGTGPQVNLGDPATVRGRRTLAQRRGLVLVVRDAVKLADLEPARDFLAISGWPLLGVIIAPRGGIVAVTRRPSATELSDEVPA